MNKKKLGTVKRTLYYFWKALMQYKTRTIIVIILVPGWIFISNVLVPYGTSQIVGKLSDGDFELANYVGILFLTILPSVFNNLVIVRILDWLDWSLDAKCGEYLSVLAFDAVINQSMTFHSNRFSGSLTSAANKLASAFIRLKSSFLWDIYPLILTIIFSIGASAIVCLPFAAILIIYAVAYLAVSITTYYKTIHVDEDLAKRTNCL